MEINRTIRVFGSSSTSEYCQRSGATAWFRNIDPTYLIFIKALHLLFDYLLYSSEESDASFSISIKFLIIHLSGIQSRCDWGDHTAACNLPSKSKWTLEWISPRPRAECYPLSRLRSRLDQVKVIGKVRSYPLRRSNQQNLFSITAAMQGKMDSMHIDRYWFGNFRRDKHNGSSNCLTVVICLRVMSRPWGEFYTLMITNKSAV